MKTIHKLINKSLSILNYIRLLSINYIVKLTPQKKSNRKTILIVKTDAIGDFVIWAGYGDALCGHYNNYRSVLICSRGVVELAKNALGFDEIIGIETNRFKTHTLYRLSLMRKIRSISADLTINPCRSRNFLVADSIVDISGAEKKIGIESDNWNMSNWQSGISDKWYSKLLPSSNDAQTEHDINRLFLNGLGINCPKYINPTLLSNISHDSITGLPSKYAVIFPGAGWVGRRWPIKNYVDIIDWLWSNYRLTAVIAGGEEDVLLGKKITSSNSTLKSIDITGKTTLIQLVEIIRNSAITISNETSSIHIAAAVDAPSICILGGGHFGRFAPYPSNYGGNAPICVYETMECFNCNWICPKPTDSNGTVQCISKVTPSRVKEKIVRIMANRVAKLDI